MVKIGMIINDRYEIIEKIGTGGMSDVYKALDSKLNRYVAVKVLKQEFGENENFVSKFRVEAQAAAGLMHSNIVNVYDVGEENDIHYIVMELVEGITLKKYIEKKARLTYKEAVSIAIQVSLGIEAAHANHIIHRDIKPQNIIISRDGKVKVTDFGIAKAATSNTITSNVMGSVHYTSPEQARGGYSDEKSDIYSLGISMFEMLTGRVPFNGETTVAIAIKHIQEEMPSPREYVAEIPQCVESIIYKCCEKSPDRRYQSMAELIVDLKQALLTPEVDFVKKDDPLVSGGTRVVSDDEVAQIKNAKVARTGLSETERLMTLAPGNIKESDQVNEDNQYEQGYDEASYEGQEYYDNNGEYYQDEYSDQQYYGTDDGQQYSDDAYAHEDGYDGGYDAGGLEDEDDINPKTERITTIIAIVVGVVIIGIIIVLAVTLFGKMSGKTPSNPGESQSPVLTEDGDGDEEKFEQLPLMTGIDVEIVRTELFGLGMSVLSTYEESDQIDAGIVMAVKDAEGKELNVGDMVKRGTTISLTVSSGKGGIELPSVEGSMYESAENALKKLGFVVNKIEAADAAVKEGYVVSQTPAAGETVPEGSTITLTVSTGPEVKSVRVPKLVGLAEEDAAIEVVEAGLLVGEVKKVNSETVPAGSVCEQSIEAGSYVDEKTTIDLTISLGSAVVTYKYEANITAPTTEEAPDYKSGTSVKVTLVTSDGKTLLETNVTSFPLSSNYYGLTASGGTITLAYEVESDPVIDPETGETKPGAPVTKTVTRSVTFTQEAK